MMLIVAGRSLRGDGDLALRPATRFAGVIETFSGAILMTIKDGEIELACPGCGEKAVHEFGRLQREQHFVCAGCGQRVRVETDEITKAIAKAKKALAEQIRRINNKLR